MRNNPNLKIEADKLNNTKLIKKFLDRHKRKDPEELLAIRNAEVDEIVREKLKGIKKTKIEKETAKTQ